MADPQSFIEDYYRTFVEVLQSFDKAPLTGILTELDALAQRGGTLWVAGNGGSAAIADHTVCDASKGTFVDGRPPLRCVSLASNGPMVTAIGNDIDFASVFSQQLTYYARPGDCVLLVSSSGNSPNVVNACSLARSMGLTSIAFVGFSGGRLAELADHVVHVAIDNYGIAEDTHQSLMHVITQYLKCKWVAENADETADANGRS